MYDDLVLLLMGITVAAMLLAVVIVQSRLSKGKPDVVEEPEDEKIYVERGFEPEEEPETVAPEPINESVEFDLEPIEPAYEPIEDLAPQEPEEVFIEAPFEAYEPVIIETPQVIIEESEPEPKEETVKPMFEASYEPSEPVVIESPEINVLEEPATVEFDTDREGPLFDISYEESEAVVIETESMILEPKEAVESVPEVDMELAPAEDPEPEPEEEPVIETVEEPEAVDEAPEQENEEEPKSVVEEITEVAVEPGTAEEAIKFPEPRELRRERKPIIDESDPDINMDMGIKSCPHCGSEVPDTIYCINCGKSLDPETVES